MEFDVTGSDFIDCGNLTGLNNLSAFSTSAWINYTGVLGTKHIFISGGTLQSDRFYVQLLSSTQIRYGSGSAYNNVTTSTISSGSWHHIVTVHNGTSLDVYLDGVKQNSSPVTVVAPNANIGNDFTIGKYVLGGYEWYGKIDQVTVFDYALSSTQVSTLYGGGTAVTNPLSLSPKPIAAYQLGDQSVDNGANYLVPNNSLSDYVFNFINPSDGINVASSNVFNFGTGDFTISMWFKINSFVSFPYLFDFRPTSSPSTTAPGVYISGTNQVNLFGGGTIISGSAGKILATNIWYNFVVKRTGNTFTIHYDGGSADRTGTSTVDFNTDLEVHIGSKYDNANGFNGEISNFQVFNSALPQTGSNSIETIYNNGSPLTSMSGFTSLVAWYKLNAADTFDSSTSTWTINDYGSGSNDGTSSGMTSANLVQSDLQQTSGFSPYALSLDGTNDYLQVSNAQDLSFGTGDFTITAWIYPKTTSGLNVIYGQNSPNTYIAQLNSDFRFALSQVGVVTYSNIITANEWQQVGVKRTSGTVTLFRNGVLGTSGVISSATGGGNINIGASATSATSNFNGDISNIAVWKGIALTPTELTEIYNSGRPSNLNTFSGTKPTSWWQLGSNSSFNTNWTCLDEIGSSNAVSAGSMTNDDITNGPGYSANGLGTSSIDIVGDAPYSTANGLSVNMDVLDRSTDVPS